LLFGCCLPQYPALPPCYSPSTLHC
jgi:hypothetical protein